MAEDDYVDGADSGYLMRDPPPGKTKDLWRDLRGPAIVEYLYEATHTETGEAMSIVQCGDETWAVPEAVWGEFFERVSATDNQERAPLICVAQRIASLSDADKADILKLSAHWEDVDHDAPRDLIKRVMERTGLVEKVGHRRWEFTDFGMAIIRRLESSVTASAVSDQTSVPGGK